MKQGGSSLSLDFLAPSCTPSRYGSTIQKGNSAQGVGSCSGSGAHKLSASAQGVLLHRVLPSVSQSSAAEAVIIAQGKERRHAHCRSCGLVEQRRAGKCFSHARGAARRSGAAANPHAHLAHRTAGNHHHVGRFGDGGRGAIAVLSLVLGGRARAWSESRHGPSAKTAHPPGMPARGGARGGAVGEAGRETQPTTTWMRKRLSLLPLMLK